LRTSLGATAFLAGLDKFTNLLTDWEKYLAPQVERRLPVSGRTFMRAAGVIEMLRMPRPTSYSALKSPEMASQSCRNRKEMHLTN